MLQRMAVHEVYSALIQPQFHGALPEYFTQGRVAWSAVNKGVPKRYVAKRCVSNGNIKQTARRHGLRSGKGVSHEVSTGNGTRDMDARKTASALHSAACATAQRKLAYSMVCATSATLLAMPEWDDGQKIDQSRAANIKCSKRRNADQ
jgi:hypothetical protein